MLLPELGNLKNAPSPSQRAPKPPVRAVGWRLLSFLATDPNNGGSRAPGSSNNKAREKVRGFLAEPPAENPRGTSWRRLHRTDSLRELPVEFRAEIQPYISGTLAALPCGAPYGSNGHGAGEAVTNLKHRGSIR